MKFDAPDPPDSPECEHVLCEYCNECHFEGCSLKQPVCLTRFLLNFVNKKLTEESDQLFLLEWKAIKQGLESDDVFLDDLIEFAETFVKLFRTKGISVIYAEFYIKAKEYYSFLPNVPKL